MNPIQTYYGYAERNNSVAMFRTEPILVHKAARDGRLAAAVQGEKKGKGLWCDRGSSGPVPSAAEIQGRIRRLLWSTAGTFFLAVGIVGIAVPLLPTTPFLLLAAASYLRGSRRMHEWMLTNRVFGQYLKEYAEGKGMPLKAKIGTVALLWTMIGLTAIVTVSDLVIRMALVIIAIAVSAHILTARSRASRTRIHGQAADD